MEERLYLCAGCSTPQRAPYRGGAVVCPGCGARSVLPDRGAEQGSNEPPPVPALDEPRRERLYAQRGRPRRVTPALQSLLGGHAIFPGREAEALAIWQSLRARAASGDVAASEDMASLALLLAQHPETAHQAELITALTESSLDAAVLPRHKQEQLSRLCRRAVLAGDRPRALTMLRAMDAASSDLASDSDYRLAAAVVAASVRDGSRMLALLGARKDAVPIDDSWEALATVLRAHAQELLGNASEAVRVLRELRDPSLLDAARAAYQPLGLCERSAEVYLASLEAEGAARAAKIAGGLAGGLSWALFAVGAMLLAAGCVVAPLPETDSAIVGFGSMAVGGLFFLGGVAARLIAFRRSRRAAWLRLNGRRLPAVFVEARATGMLINRVRVYQLVLEVRDQAGPYTTTLTRPLLEHEIAGLLGKPVFARVHPSDPFELVIEE
jgi:DNA-directed RNA polymerase subunit RPC12/RpoP